MFKAKSIRVQFLTLLFVEVVLWSSLSELYWFLVEKFAYGEEASAEISWAPDLIYVFGSIAILFISTIPVFLYIIKGVNSPVKKITKGINKLADGKYEHIRVKGASEFVEIAEAFNKMSDSLEKMQELKKEIERERVLLFANMAHDIKTPITSILGFSSALSEGMVESEEKRKDYLNTITLKSMRINELIDRLFEFVKIESPENILHKSPCDIAEVLRGSLAAIYSDFEEKNMKVELSIPEVPVIKNADKLEIGRVFTNLLTNICRHNPCGTAVFVEMKENGETLIADSGEEIAQPVRKSLFKPFVSGDSARRSKNGSGLGLALSYKIMEKHGGNLSYISSCKPYTKGFLIKF